MPAIRLVVPSKAIFIKSDPRPTASKICAPWLLDISEMPILREFFLDRLLELF